MARRRSWGDLVQNGGHERGGDQTPAARSSASPPALAELKPSVSLPALAKAGKIYGGHMGAGLEEHGIWGTPERVAECIERHQALGCTGFLIEFFGRDTRPPAELFAREVMPLLGRNPA